MFRSGDITLVDERLPSPKKRITSARDDKRLFCNNFQVVSHGRNVAIARFAEHMNRDTQLHFSPMDPVWSPLVLPLCRERAATETFSSSCSGFAIQPCSRLWCGILTSRIWKHGLLQTTVFFRQELAGLDLDRIAHPGARLHSIASRATTSVDEMYLKITGQSHSDSG